MDKVASNMTEKIIKEKYKVMKLKINESFASSYNARRKKEELSKFKMKYGDVAMDETDDEESSSSDSDIDEDDILTDTRELSVINALMTNDPRIKDPNFAWFSDSDNEVKAERSVVQSSSDGRGKKQVYLRDIERLRLLDGRDKKKTDADESDGSDDPVEDDKSDLSAIKKAFLGAAAATSVSKDASLFTLKSSATNDSISSSDIIVNKNKNKDELLMEYVKKISSNVNDAKTNFRFLSDSESDEDDEGSEAAMESGKLQSEESSTDDSSDEIFVPRSAQTEVKSHPRRIPDSMRIAAEGKKQRSAKNREVRERKRREKESKKAEIEQGLHRTVELELLEYKRLKKEAAQDRVSKIKRTAAKEELKIEAKDLEEDWDPEKHEKLVKQIFDDDYEGNAEESKPVFSDDEELDNDVIDWDEWKPGTSVGREESAMSPEEGYEEDDEPGSSQTVEFGARGGGSRRRRRRRRLAGFRRALEKASSRGKPDADAARFNKEDFPEGFDDFIDKVYELDCEDIILGRGEGQKDIKCRFKYRNVEPMDFGLEADEVLSAPAKELNSWVSLKKVTQIRPKEEEERDRRLFRSSRRQGQKSRLLPTVFVPLGQDELHEADGESATTGEAAKKRKRKRKKKVEERPGEEALEEKKNVEGGREGEPAKEDKERKKSKKRKRSERGVQDRVSDARIKKLIRSK